jgi:hypothetical protein
LPQLSFSDKILNIIWNDSKQYWIYAAHSFDTPKKRVTQPAFCVNPATSVQAEYQTATLAVIPITANA